MGEILALASALSFGLSSIFVGRAVVRIEKKGRDLGVLITILINTVISTLALGIYIAAERIPTINTNAVFYFMLVGIFSSFLGRTLFFEGITHVGPARSSAIKLFGPVFTIFIGVAFLNEKLNVLTWGGLIVVLAGLFLVAWEMVLREKKKETQAPDMLDAELKLSNNGRRAPSRNIKGIALGLLAGTSYGTATVFRKVGMQALPNAFVGTWLAFSTSLVLYFSFMCRIYGFKRLMALIKGSVDINYLYSGIFTTAAQFLILLSVKMIGVGIANTLLNTDAVFTTVLGYFVLKNRERISVYTVGGVLSVTAGVAMILASKA